MTSGPLWRMLLKIIHCLQTSPDLQTITQVYNLLSWFSFPSKTMQTAIPISSYTLLQPRRILRTATLCSLGLKLEWITWWLDQTPLTKLVSVNVNVNTPRESFLSTQDDCCRNLKVNLGALAWFSCTPGLHLALDAPMHCLLQKDFLIGSTLEQEFLYQLSTLLTLNGEILKWLLKKIDLTDKGFKMLVSLLS